MILYQINYLTITPNAEFAKLQKSAEDGLSISQDEVMEEVKTAIKHGERLFNFNTTTDEFEPINFYSKYFSIKTNIGSFEYDGGEVLTRKEMYDRPAAEFN